MAEAKSPSYLLQQSIHTIAYSSEENTALTQLTHANHVKPLNQSVAHGYVHGISCIIFHESEQLVPAEVQHPSRLRQDMNSTWPTYTTQHLSSLK